MAKLTMQEESSAPSTPATNKWVVYFKAGGLYIKDDTGAETGPITTDHGSLSGLSDDDHPQYQKVTGFIQENSAKLTYVGTQAYSVSVGTADVNGTLLTWASNISRSSLSFSADTLYNVYLYSNSGTPAVEESTTAPVWDSTLNYWKKTGDNTRRWIGYLSTDASGLIRKFVHIIISGRISEIIFVDGSTTGKAAVNAGTQSASWASFSLSPLVPVPATHYYGVARLAGTAANDDASAGISPIDLGSALGALAPFVVRGDNDVAGAIIFFGTTMLPISTAQTNYYRLYHVVGTGSTLTLHIHGSRFSR